MYLTIIKATMTLTAALATPHFSGDAYLDPGSGSFILQILIASFLGAAFLIKTYWQKIVTIFRDRRSKQEEDDKG